MIIFIFLVLLRIKTKLTKCEIVGIGVVKRGQLAVCGMRCIDLNNDTLKLLGTHFSSSEKLKVEKNFHKAVTDIQRVLKKWKMRNLTLEGKIVIFKNTAISKIIFQSSITTVPKHILNELEKIQDFILGKLYS